jgi:DNA polymerase epsilon subunit 1
VKSRLKAYSQRVYKKSKVTDVKEKSNTVCMRENSFYVDTVKAFRDRSPTFNSLLPSRHN